MKRSKAFLLKKTPTRAFLCDILWYLHVVEFFRRKLRFFAKKLASEMHFQHFLSGSLKTAEKHRRRSLMVIASNSRTEDPGFESRQGVRFLGLNTLNSSCQNFICIDCHYVYLREINALEYFFIIAGDEQRASYVCLYGCIYVPMYVCRCIHWTQERQQTNSDFAKSLVPSYHEKLHWRMDERKK
jgi:hypothetical protein